MIRKIKNFIQRGIKGYSDEDLWDLDFYLSELISNSIKDFKKIQHGIPVEFYNKYKDREDLTQKQKDKLAIKDFNKILDDISKGFNYLHLVYEWQFNSHSKKYIIARINFLRAFDLLKENFHNLND